MCIPLYLNEYEMNGRDDVTSWCMLILEKLVLMQLVRMSPAFMNTEDLSSC
jgi:hypothetical protein